MPVTYLSAPGDWLHLGRIGRNGQTIVHRPIPDHLIYLAILVNIVLAGIAAWLVPWQVLIGVYAATCFVIFVFVLAIRAWARRR